MNRKFRVLTVVASTMTPAFFCLADAQHSPRTLVNQALTEADGADPNTRNETGETPLDLARMHNRAVLEILVAIPDPSRIGSEEAEQEQVSR